MYVSVGEKHGRLTVVKFLRLHFIPSSPTPNYKFLCKCDCGNTAEVSDIHLKKGYTKSCGCLKYEARLPAYMKDYRNFKEDRARLPQHPVFLIFHKWIRDYGVCEEWKDYLVFKEFIINFREECGKNLTLIDLSKVASPDNVRSGNPQGVMILMGTKFGMLTVIDTVKRKHKGQNRRFLCKCDCGKEVVKYLFQLKDVRAIKSCGCVKKQNPPLINKNLESLKNIPTEYAQTYWGIKWRRILEKKQVCEEWKYFKGFLKFVNRNNIKEGVILRQKDKSKPMSPKNILLGKEYPNKMKGARVEVGERINKLVVIHTSKEYTFQGSKRVFEVFCKCDCGRGKTFKDAYLKSSKPHSCGCARKNKNKI